MNSYAFNYLLEQLKQQEDEFENLNRKIIVLQNSMKIMEANIISMNKKLGCNLARQHAARKK